MQFWVVNKKQQNVPAGHVMKVVAAIMDYALWFFRMEDFDIDVGNDNEIFSSHWREKTYISAN